jgi:exopolysaccharide production protein ExoQ
LIAPALMVFAPLGAAALLALAGSLLLASDWRSSLAAIRPVAPLAIVLAFLSLWGAFTALWSPLPLHSALQGGRLLLLSALGLIVFGSGLSLSPRDAKRLGRAAVAGVTIAVLLLQIELWSGAVLAHWLSGAPRDTDLSLTRYDRGATFLLLASWPAAAALAAAARWRLLGLGVVVVAGTLFALNSVASDLAAVGGLAALLVAWRMPRLIAALLISGVALLAFALPVLAPDGRTIEQMHQAAPALKQSAIHRLVIWRFASERIAERPFLGWGMDASRALPGGHAHVREVMPEVTIQESDEVLPLHPHDAALQWRLELGVPGTLLCLVGLFAVLWPIVANPAMVPRDRALALGYAASVLAIAMLSFGAWQAWWLSSVWLTAALLAGIGQDAQRAPERGVVDGSFRAR